MTEQKKKKLIILLLFTSCVISGYLLLNHPTIGKKPLQNFAQADSLIIQELYNFNIRDEQIREVATRVDSNFVRKTYWVKVAPQFSKTQFHAELNKTLFDFNVSTPGKVIFPHKDVRIHLKFNNTVIRSIILQTDPELTITRNRASLLFVFNDEPSGNVLDKLAALGEPFPVVLKVENPIQANQMRDQLNEKYSKIIYWLSSKNDGQFSRSKEVQAIYRQMKEVMPDATVLRILEDTSPSDEQHKIVVQTGLSSVVLQNPVIIENNLGRSAFMDKLQTFASQSAVQNHPVALIYANEQLVDWISERLPELKKNGLNFVHPPVTVK